MKLKKRSLFGILLSFALMLTMMPALGLTQTGYAVSYAETWGEDQTVETSRTIDGGVRITNDITIRIEKGVTLTVNGSIAANNTTVTVKGPGKLVVNGAGGNNGISGNINVKGADVEITGKPGSDATQAGFDGSDGGWAVYGNVVVYDGSIKAIGGNGGNGAGDGVGGYGGYGIYGDLTVNGGSAFASGGNGGSGMDQGVTEKAVSGSLSGTTFEESNDGDTWTTVSGSKSSKQYVKATGPDTISIKLNVGAGHAGLFADEGVISDLEDAVNASYATISGNVITFNGVNASKTENWLWNRIDEAIWNEHFPIDNYEIWFSVGFKSLDKYAIYRDFYNDIYDEKHDAPASEGFTLYLLWQMPYTKLNIDNGNPTCGQRSWDAEPTIPDGMELDPEYSYWEYEGEFADVFKGGNEYTYTAYISLSNDADTDALWKYFFNIDNFTASVKGGKNVEYNVKDLDTVVVKFTATADHDWDEGKVTKKPTTTKEGEKLYTCKTPDCGATKTEAIPKLKPTPSKVGGTLLGKMTAGKKSLKITWNKVKGADGYDIFFARCDSHGKKITYKKTKTIKGNKTFKWTKSGLRKGTPYKAYVKAYTIKNGKKTYIKKSPTMHAYTGNATKRYTNAKSVTVKKAKVSLKKGKTYKIKAKVNKIKKNKKLMSNKHVAKLRYLTSNKKVATVSKSGKITAKGKGQCTITVLAHNGVSKNVKVTVK